MTGLRIAVFQHHPAEGPGRIARWAEERGHALSVCMPGETGWRDDCDALILLGGPQSVNDVPPWLQEEMTFVERLVRRGTPVLGICLGAQILAKALGAEVRAMSAPEAGWKKVRFKDGSALEVLQWHEEAVELPPHAICLAASDACAVQAYRAPGRCIGLQFHPEWDAGSVEELNRAFGDASPFRLLSRDADTARHRRVRAWFDDLLDAWISA